MNYKSGFDKKRISFLKSFTILFGICLVVFLFLLNHLGTRYQDIKEKRTERKLELIKETKKVQEIEAYNFWIKRAENYLTLDMYNEAYKDFLFAHRINKRGKRANLGIAICLKKQCKHKVKHCNEAEEYYQTLLKSGNFNITELERIKTS